jgi:hypothetical protein
MALPPPRRKSFSKLRRRLSQTFRFSRPRIRVSKIISPFFISNFYLLRITVPNLPSFVMSKVIVPKYWFPEKRMVSLCNKKINTMARKSFFSKDFYSCSSKANYFAPSFIESFLSYTSLMISVKHIFSATQLLDDLFWNGNICYTTSFLLFFTWI